MTGTRCSRNCRNRDKMVARSDRSAHTAVIQTFVRDLPRRQPVDTVMRAEWFRAQHAATLRPDQLEEGGEPVCGC